MPTILNGTIVAKQLQQQLHIQLQSIKRPLRMGIILVGQNPASVHYIKRKQKMANQLKIAVQLEQLDTDATTEQVCRKIDSLNNDPHIDGFIVQLPLPSHIDQLQVLDRICPYKDIDGLNTWSLGKLLSGQPLLVSATARGIIHLLKFYDIALAGQEVVMVGRSVLVGKPTALLLLQEGATVTIAHRQTKNLEHVTRRADILVVAAGQPELITEDYVKSNAVVIDVGLTKVEDSFKGDVDQESVGLKASAISPVPGGVGPLTVICLFENLLQAYHLQHTSGHQHQTLSNLA